MCGGTLLAGEMRDVPAALQRDRGLMPELHHRNHRWVRLCVRVRVCVCVYLCEYIHSM